ncbi:unnamed protein product [Pleuronectes platessa]|uniref:Uncharacterized protein n=1 Tax=Pleuronectes platessa TaxID=8262 RepID=A0A9N7U732_PLEPL|nr:unnamed protein product [Pleuronectes platessa]
MTSMHAGKQSGESGDVHDGPARTFVGPFAQFDLGVGREPGATNAIDYYQGLIISTPTAPRYEQPRQHSQNRLESDRLNLIHRTEGTAQIPSISPSTPSVPRAAPPRYTVRGREWVAAVFVCGNQQRLPPQKNTTYHMLEAVFQIDGLEVFPGSVPPTPSPTLPDSGGLCAVPQQRLHS